MAASSPYDTAVANTLNLAGSWFFRDYGTTTATATAGGVNGTYTGVYGQQVVSPLARDSSTPLSVPYGDVIAGVRIGCTANNSTAPGLGYVTFGASNFTYINSAAFSIVALVRLRGDMPTAYTWAEQEIVDKSTSASRTGYDLAINASRQPMFRRWNAGTADTVTSTTSLTPGVWYFVAGTFDGTTYRVYVDDAPVSYLQPTAPVAYTTSTASLTAGGWNAGNGATWDGDIGPLSIYNRALAQIEVSALFSAAFVAAPRTFYVNSSTGSDSYDGTSATFVSGSTGPWASFFHTASTIQAGDTAVFAYNSGTPYVETQLRPYSAMAYSGTKRSPVTFTGDLLFGSTTAPTRVPTSNDLLPIIQFGTLSTGTNIGAVTAASWSGGATTYSVASTSGLTAGQSFISITGATPSGYNVASALVTSLVTNTSVTVAMANTPGVWSSGGTIATGIDLSNQLKMLVLQQCNHVIQGLHITQPAMGSDWNDRLCSFFGQQYLAGFGPTTAITGDGTTLTVTVASTTGLTVGTQVSITGALVSGANVTEVPIFKIVSGTQFQVRSTFNGTASTQGWVTRGLQLEVQTLSLAVAATTGNVTIHLPGNTTYTFNVVNTTAATVQAGLRATVSSTASGAGALSNIVVTGGPLTTSTVLTPMTLVWAGSQSNPYEIGPMSLMVIDTQPTNTVTAARTTAGTNSMRWYQSADFCIMQFCRLRNAYQPYKSAVDTGSQFTYNLVEACGVGIGCVGSNSPIFANNYFLCNGTGQALRNGGNLVQQDGIQSKGGTRNAQIYGNVVRVPVGATALTGVGIYVGGASNDMSGLYDNSATGKEGYNNVAYNNVVIGEFANAFGIAGIAIGGGQNDTVANNVIINGIIGLRIIRGGNWPTTNSWPKTTAPTIINNIVYQSAVTTGTAAFRYVNGESLDYDGVALGIIYTHNLRYQMANADDAITSGFLAASSNPIVDVGANVVDPQFINYLTDWHLRPGTVAAQAGIATTRVAFGQGYARSTTFDLQHDASGYLRSSTPDLGVYAWATGAEADASVTGSSGTLGVDTIGLGLDDVTAPMPQSLRQVMVYGDPASRGALTRVLSTDPVSTDWGSVVRPVPMRSSTATVTSVASSASSVTLLATNSTAKGRFAYNNSTQVLYLKFGTTASTSSFTVAIPASGYYEFPAPLYTGRVDGIWASANGNVMLTEEI